MTTRSRGANSITDEQAAHFREWFSRWLDAHCSDGEKRWSQRRIGERLAISQNEVSAWQNDAARPGLPRLIHLYRVTGVSIESMLGLGPPKTAADLVRQRPTSAKP